MIDYVGEKDVKKQETEIPNASSDSGEGDVVNVSKDNTRGLVFKSCVSSAFVQKQEPRNSVVIYAQMWVT